MLIIYNLNGLCDERRERRKKCVQYWKPRKMRGKSSDDTRFDHDTEINSNRFIRQCISEYE